MRILGKCDNARIRCYFNIYINSVWGLNCECVSLTLLSERDWSRVSEWKRRRRGEKSLSLSPRCGCVCTHVYTCARPSVRRPKVGSAGFVPDRPRGSPSHRVDDQHERTRKKYLLSSGLQDWLLHYESLFYSSLHYIYLVLAISIYMYAPFFVHMKRIAWL